MDTIFFRNLFLEMALIIHTLFEVQAITPMSVSIHNTLVLCIWTNHKDCQPMAYHGSQEEYGRCMIQSFQDCMDNPLYKDDLDYHVGKKCKLYCNEKETKSAFRLGFCLIDCFLH